MTSLEAYTQGTQYSSRYVYMVFAAQVKCPTLRKLHEQIL